VDETPGGTSGRIMGIVPDPSTPVCVKYRLLHPSACAPRRMTADAAAADVAAFVPGDALRIEPRARAIVQTGVVLAIPSGYEGQLRPRSGRALRDGLMIVNSPATIDADFRGELCVLLLNAGDEPITISHGERIAQLVIAPVPPVVFEEVAELPDDTARGAGGFGSTGA
jgi:dUTP pyrophosphatase